MVRVIGSWEQVTGDKENKRCLLCSLKLHTVHILIKFNQRGVEWKFKNIFLIKLMFKSERVNVNGNKRKQSKRNKRKYSKQAGEVQGLRTMQPKKTSVHCEFMWYTFTRLIVSMFWTTVLFGLSCHVLTKELSRVKFYRKWPEGKRKLFPVGG